MHHKGNVQTWPFMQATVQQDSAPIPPPLRAHAHAHACATHARTARKYRAGGGPCYLPSRSAICTLTYRTQLISLRASCLLSEHRPGTGRCVFVDRGFPMKITVPTCASRVPFEKKNRSRQKKGYRLACSTRTHERIVSLSRGDNRYIEEERQLAREMGSRY